MIDDDTYFDTCKNIYNSLKRDNEKFSFDSVYIPDKDNFRLSEIISWNYQNQGYKEMFYKENSIT